MSGAGKVVNEINNLAPPTYLSGYSCFVFFWILWNRYMTKNGNVTISTPRISDQDTCIIFFSM